MNHPHDDLEQPIDGSPVADDTCGWCENLFDAGTGAVKDVDGKPLLLCPDCLETYAECEVCVRHRPGVRTISSDAWIYGTDRTTACGECTASPYDDRDEEYERAAARARSNDFADTDGKDWT